MGGPRVVQWSRFSDAFQRLFGLQGNTALNVVDDVFLTLPAEEDAAHLAYLRGWTRFAASITQNGGVGVNAHVSLVCPVSNLLVVVDTVYITPQLAGLIQVGVDEAPEASLRGVVLDTRQAPVPLPAGGALTARVGVAAGAPAAPVITAPLARFTNTGNGDLIRFDCGIVLARINARMVVECTVSGAGNGLACTWVGRYRELTQQEQ